MSGANGKGRAESVASHLDAQWREDARWDGIERPYTAVLDLSTQESIYEYACHEGNRGLENILSAARSEERAAAASAR